MKDISDILKEFNDRAEELGVKVKNIKRQYEQAEFTLQVLATEVKLYLEEIKHTIKNFKNS